MGDAAKILLEHGGIFPYLNLISLLVAVTIIVERSIALRMAVPGALPPALGAASRDPARSLAE